MLTSLSFCVFLALVCNAWPCEFKDDKLSQLFDVVIAGALEQPIPLRMRKCKSEVRQLHVTAGTHICLKNISTSKTVVVALDAEANRKVTSWTLPQAVRRTQRTLQWGS